MPPVRVDELPAEVPLAGVYLFSEGRKHLYVGRSNRIRRRIGRHCGDGLAWRGAAFAFRLAREATGKLRASYRTDGSRGQLMTDAAFVEAFRTAKRPIRSMKVRFVEETDPCRQALLEIYAALALKAPYNDFSTH
jgi:predicted GIY-YIG superfamily endonuclease